MNDQPGFQNKSIALVANSAWSVYNFRLDIIRHFRQHGLKVFVIAPDDEYSELLRNEGCEFVPISFNNRTENPLLDLMLYRQLKKLYTLHRPDLVFHYVIKPNIYGSLAAAACKIDSIAVITGLGYSFARKNILYRIVSMLYKRALRKTREVWFLNNEDAAAFIREELVNIEKVKVLPGEGVNTDFFSPSKERSDQETDHFRFLMSTRLLKSKGVSLYADAARILKKKGYNVTMDLIGFYEKNHPDSIAEEELKKWEQEGLIRYHGFARDVRPYLQQADAFVFPSFYNEGVPRCLMEAAAMELPILTSFNRGCKEVVLNNSNGFTCKVHDAFDLSDKMEKLINLSAIERKRMGKNGRALVQKKFNISKVIEEYDRTLRSLA